MATLSNSEEILMGFIWQNENVVLKEIIKCYPEPKPAKTTVATLLKRLHDKGFIDYTTHGNVRVYHSVIKKETYSSQRLNKFIKHIFEGSYSQFASFFTTQTELNKEELESLQKMIKEQIKKTENG